MVTASVVSMTSPQEIAETVDRVKETPAWLLHAKACPECFALVPADQGAVSAHKAWHDRHGSH